MLKEFKEFAIKGNVVDLAIGVVIGSAFGKIVTSMVNDIIMPIASAITGGVNFTYLKIVIKEAKGDIPAVTLNYGSFIQNVIDFLIVSFSIFLFISLINKLKKENKPKSSDEQNKQSEEITLLQEIRDLLKNNKNI
ncbi:large-conductance mechanosensitive channel protein MscL [Clostridium sp. SHJSY1]|uniref:large-conductance mechanosensitive channel protein MscL n=1 Tax=Clostridium sp. SHJSY1 TaxID=2942483 RepID=UPI002876DA68|nr:large-conductance mechanosensitive channel protein MscL [Clostridium sp. SHJSY1]MDS0524485.1 large-conductance mechanosensitive channel protein MscL [Clostridium sp. SHJSY1]